MSPSPVSYKRHRFPPQIIAHAVWLYFRFPLSLRLVEEMLLERGIIVSYETVRRWAMKFGPDYAGRLKRKKPGRRDVWRLDEVVVSISGEKGVVTFSACQTWLPAPILRDDQNQLRRLPLPARDHSTGDLAISSVHSELS